MKSCSFCKQVIKPYQLSSSDQISGGAFYSPDNSNIGFVSTSEGTFSNHMGCSKVVNKKIWPWIILGFAFIIAFCILFVLGMVDFFGAKSYDWDSNGSVTIIDQARKTKDIT